MVMRMDKAKNAAVCAVFIALIAAGAYIKVPISFIPVTMQTTFVLLSGLLLGGKRGALSCAGYMLLGLAGLPIFTSGGGLGYVFMPTFGYIIGFCPGAYLSGTIARKKSGVPTMARLLAGSAAGLGAIYAAGLAYLFLNARVLSANPVPAGTLLTAGFLSVIPYDLAFAILGSLLAKKLLSLKVLGGMVSADSK
jgi:biotin transport system substrate-specific component